MTADKPAAAEAGEPAIDDIRAFFVGLQATIVAALADVEGAAFRRDDWQRPAGGGGR